jgi:protein-tyrosine phosphatase
VPILTHPERLSWINSHYGAIERLARAGVWMQITAGSLAGAFGRNARYWAERMLDEGRVHILATDAHDTKKRPPNLREGRELAAVRVGADEAERLVVGRPKGVLMNLAPSDLPAPVAARDATGQHAFAATDAREGPDNAGGLGGISRQIRRFFE